MTEPGRGERQATDKGRLPAAKDGRDERRRYNRRAPVSDVTPPYFETFDRIAVALERIERALEQEVASPDATEGSTQSADEAAVASRGSGQARPSGGSR